MTRLGLNVVWENIVARNAISFSVEKKILNTVLSTPSMGFSEIWRVRKNTENVYQSAIRPS